MKVLCLHGRGSNNEIFKLQTGRPTEKQLPIRSAEGLLTPIPASFRADLPEFEFEFVQGTVPHTEGNWSLFTTSFSELPLYNYYNPLSATSILQLEKEMVKLVEEEGPFDGVIGYSGGAAVAAQLLIRDRRESPWKLPHESIFRWAVFINAGTPLEVFRLADVEAREGIITDSAPEREAASIFLRPSNVRVRKGTERHPDYDPEQIQRDLSALHTRQLIDGRLFMSDGTFGITRYDAGTQGALVDIPTLHVRNPTVENRHWGLEMLELCQPSTAKEFFHYHGHDFPRGRADMKEVARLIRETAECAT